MIRIIRYLGLTPAVYYLIFRLFKKKDKKSDLLSLFSMTPYLKSASDFYYMEYNGLAFKIRKRSSDSSVFHQIFHKGEYLPLIDLWPKLGYSFEKDLIVVDAGANVGLFSLFLLQHFRSIRLIAIEPHPENHKLLVKNLSGKFRNVLCLEKALWYNNRPVSFSSDFRDGKEWSYAVDSDKISSGSDMKSTITLQDVVDLAGHGSIDILKIDIEGSEKYLLKDEKTVNLLFSVVKLLIIEIHNEVMDPFDFVELLRENNYSYLHYGETFFCYRR